MKVEDRLEILSLAPPLDQELAHGLTSFLDHKGSPWIDDIRRRTRGAVIDARDRFMVARIDGQLVSHAWYTASARDNQLGLIGHVYTHPDHRRRGIAGRVLERAMADFRASGGTVMQLYTSTPFSIGFYERLGFENLFARKVYHETDWYMRWPAGSTAEMFAWAGTGPFTIRSLSSGDLPQYCLLYNLEHQSVLKDWPQRIGTGLEAELAFIETHSALAAGRGVCHVLQGERTLAGAAMLLRSRFPHQAHLGKIDVYLPPEMRYHAPELLDRCWQRRNDLGVETVYALAVDDWKRSALSRVGFVSAGMLTGHYKVEDQYYDGELLRRP